MPPKKASTSANGKLKFEDCLQELESIVRKLENDEVNLDNLVEIYKRGKFLTTECTQRINEVKMIIETVDHQ